MKMNSNILNSIQKISKEEKVEAKEIIVREGDILSKVGFIEKGLVKVNIKVQNNNKLFIYCLDNEQNNMIAFIQQFSSKNIQPVEIEVIALTDTVIRWIPLSKYNKLMEENEHVKMKLIETIEFCNTKILDVLIDLNGKSIIDKIKDYLKELKKYSGTNTIILEKKEIAKDLNIPVDIISLKLKEIIHTGLITLKKDRLFLS
ncbi:Crp/Fnr family transcriptional regulator [Aquimarina rhabdastrellae]